MHKRAQFAVTAEHIGFAVLHLHDLEREPRKNGGKAGAEQVDRRVKAKRNIRWLIEEYDRQSMEIPEVPMVGAEGRRLEGRSVDDGSMSSEVATTTEACKSERTVKATK